MLRDTGQRFEWSEQGGTCFADYRVNGDRLSIDYVESPVTLRGTGAAGRLMTEIAKIAKSKNYKIVPICGYAASWLRRSEEFRDLIAD